MPGRSRCPKCRGPVYSFNLKENGLHPTNTAADDSHLEVCLNSECGWENDEGVRKTLDRYHEQLGLKPVGSYSGPGTPDYSALLARIQALEAAAEKRRREDAAALAAAQAGASIPSESKGGA
jgi:hypothetical protein